MPDATDDGKLEEERYSSLKEMTDLHGDIVAPPCVLTNNISRDDDGEKEDYQNQLTDIACQEIQRKTEDGWLVKHDKFLTSIHLLSASYSPLFVVK